jgi:phosphatidylserine/phosphatidylglycerophosphate/cardiolipin synthase-like enzyme
MNRLIHNEEHYTEVINRIGKAQRFVWIGTADIKDLHVKTFHGTASFLATLNNLASKKIAIRLMYAKHPGPIYNQSRKKFPLLDKTMEEVLCIRVHFKIIIIDGTFAYIGSANLTGAGLGMKSKNNRNFETGLITSDNNLIEQAMQQFDNVWMGAFCKDCGRKDYCEKTIIE